MATQGGPAKAVSAQTGGRQQGGAALPVAVVSDGRAVEGGPAQPVYVVTSGPVQGGPAQPIVAAASGAIVAAGPAVPVYVVSGSLNPTPAVPSVYLLQDLFTTPQAAPITSPRTCEPGPGTLIKNDPAGRLAIVNGRLNVGSGSGAWDNPSVWSTALDGATFGAVGALFRIHGGSNAGPALILHSAANVDPTAAGRGLYYLQPDMKSNTGALTVSTGARVRSIDYVLAIVRRTGGGNLLVLCGGIYGTFPSGTLVWIDDTDSIAASAYIGLSDKTGDWEADYVRAVVASDMPALLQTRHGAALAADTFAGSGSIAGRATEVGGLTWAFKAGGSGTVSGGKAHLSIGGGSCYVIVMPASLPRIVELTCTAPSSGICDSWVAFRSSAGVAQAYYFRATKTGVDVYSDYAAGFVMQTGAYTIANGQTYRLRVIDYGTLMQFYLDNTLVGTFTSALGAGNFGCGMVRSSDDAATPETLFDDFAAWPATITLPTDLGPVPAVPTGTGAALITDTFTAADGTLLPTYNPAWHTDGPGVWEVRSNKARVSVAATLGYAYRDSTTTADHEVSCDVTTPNTTPVFPTDWYVGVVARWTDNQNMLFARLLYQNNSTEVELREANNSSGAVIGYVNMGAGGIVPNTTYTLRMACKGSEIAVYLNGELVVQSTTAVLSGTNVGMGVEGPTSGIPTFDTFTVKAT